MASADTLDVAEVHTYYGESYVLQGLSVSVRRGQIVAVLGRNGMGKTTLIRSIAGLTPPRAGRITYRGQDLARLPPYRIARLGVGLVPQGRRVFPSLTVRENLLIAASRFTGGKRRDDGWTLDAILHEFGRLAERLAQRAGHLSGGEQQMLAIGRALMANPNLILMDEPSEGLAPLIVEHLAGIMRTIRQRGHSILLVEQNVGLALAVADYVYVMASGRIAHEGTPAAIGGDTKVLTQHIGV